MKTVVYGGGFDPFGLHHAACVEFMFADPEVEHVLIVPSMIHPDKGKVSTPFSRRYDMIVASIADMNAKLRRGAVGVSAIEQNLCAGGEPAYSYDVLCALTAIYPKLRLTMGVGPDRMDVAETWHRGRELVSIFGLYPLPDTLSYRASDIRRKVAEGDETWREMMSPTAAQVIETYGLYKGSA